MTTKKDDRPTPGPRRRSTTVTENAVSAGGVVYRTSGGEAEVVICGRDSDGVWGLPKGTPDEGESLEETALREVNEETGLEVNIVDKISVIEYWFSRERVRYHKFVHYYLMDATGGDTDAHDIEYDRVEWVSIGAALRKLSFKNEIDTVTKAREMIEART